MDKIAYFSMEVALEPDIPTYSGGLGILSGDTLRSAADLSLPVVGISLIYSGGYFYQLLTQEGNQIEKPIRWDFLDSFEDTKKIVRVPLQDKEIAIKAWRYIIHGITGHELPVLLLDTNLPENEPWQRNLTSALYDAHKFNRVTQELILGIGGVKMLDALGYDGIETYHMNEGHSAFLMIELLKRYKTIDALKQHCVFTTHTPVEAGHERFDRDVIDNVFRGRIPAEIDAMSGKNPFNMTLLALNGSRYTNGVSQKHGQVSSKMFPGHDIDAITNGVHSNTWVSPYMAKVFDDELGMKWRLDPSEFKNILKVNSHGIWQAHVKAKRDLFDYERSHSNVHLKDDLLTIGYARRAAEYKRPLMVLTDIERLAKIAKGKVQFVFAGKSHPADNIGKGMIKQIHEISNQLWDSYEIRSTFLENYDWDLGKMMTSGVDVWLNNPRRYNEASGTSGMKAALNGVLNCSTLDGWWIEGYAMDPLAGWAIGPGLDDPNAESLPDSADAADLYRLLEDEIIPLWRKNEAKWMERMVHAVRLASFFNTNRMMEEYADKAYRLARGDAWVAKPAGTKGGKAGKKG
jgi:glycogen phosphorylase